MSSLVSRSLSAVLPAPGQVLDTRAIRDTHRRLAVDFAAMASELLDATDEQLEARLKVYDNRHRLTLGRAMTPLLDGRTVASGDFTFDCFDYIRSGDASAFVSALSINTHPAVWAALRGSLDNLCEDLPPQDRVRVSLFCHRVLVRPGEGYQGFSHRDNKPGEKCGTCVCYPRVDAEKIAGASIFCRWEREAQFDGAEVEPANQEITVPPSAYAGTCLLLRYPHNLAHGVTAGRHRFPAQPDREISVRDFLLPHPDDFVKDLMIVTISEAPNAED